MRRNSLKPTFALVLSANIATNLHPMSKTTKIIAQMSARELFAPIHFAQIKETAELLSLNFYVASQRGLWTTP